jgi:hypothetical protein
MPNMMVWFIRSKALTKLTNSTKVSIACSCLNPSADLNQWIASWQPVVANCSLALFLPSTNNSRVVMIELMIV